MWYLNTRSHEYYVYLDNAFNGEECRNIIDYATNKLEFKDAQVVLDNSLGKVDKNIRKNTISWIKQEEDINWLYRKLTDIVNSINKQFWNFDLEYIETLQFTRYSELNDGYDKHMDLDMIPTSYRKLSFSLQLTDGDDYDGCDLVISPSGENKDIFTKRNRGTINFFPSYMVHHVTPLKSGKRDAIVGWVCGPSFK